MLDIRIGDRVFARGPRAGSSPSIPWSSRMDGYKLKPMNVVGILRGGTTKYELDRAVGTDDSADVNGSGYWHFSHEHGLTVIRPGQDVITVNRNIKMRIRVGDFVYRFVNDGLGSHKRSPLAKPYYVRGFDGVSPIIAKPTNYWLSFSRTQRKGCQVVTTPRTIVVSAEDKIQLAPCCARKGRGYACTKPCNFGSSWKDCHYGAASYGREWSYERTESVS